jgi:ferredoxin-NADP reductase/Na+-translocating ferredoxin:NAD+ oxidoreductase RnfD subunit
MIEFVDSLLNKITMYRLTLYYLILLIGVAVILSFFGFLAYNPFDILLDTLITVVVSYIANYAFAKMFKVITNVESVFITALILVLIIPIKFPTNAAFFVFASILAMGAKYLLTIEKRHIFNPAAIAVVAISLLSNYSATWWIGTPIMLPFVIVGGLLLIRKIGREQLVFNFLLAYLFIVAVGSILHSGTIFSVLSTWQLTVFHSALFFFTFVMLIEPVTSPATKKLQSYYAYVVALLYATPQLRLISVTFTPEMALSIGNVFSYFISPNYRLNLPLKWKKQLSPDTFAFGFNRVSNFKFIPGQYMEWTLPHKNSDSRGNRRYFSLASSPTENDIIMTVKFYNPSSSYKKTLLSMTEGQKIIASQVAGDFTLPKDLNKPLVFIAGGVGIAPFRSMISYIIDKKLSSNIVLFYSNRTVNEILFSDTFQKAESYGVKTIYTLTDVNNVPGDWQRERGYITEAMIKQNVGDYHQRTFYISGPQLMVQNFEKLLLRMEVKKKNIITDFFPGYSESK